MRETKKGLINNRYQIEKQLSHKAGRRTLLALDRTTQQQVIIKLLEFNSLFEWDDLKLFEREAKTLKNLDHSAIPKYLDYFEIDNEQISGFALVQTYIDASSLADTIQQGRKFTEAELIELAQKLLNILDYLHSSNPPIIHRDIKPSNILLSNRTGNSIGELYLVDFGSVQTAACKTEGTITIVGSYGYIPLEQFGGQATNASDLYSLGMTLIYIITGVHPAELPHKNGRVQFDANHLSNRLQPWLNKMTEPYLDRRFEDAKSALADLLMPKLSSVGSFLNIKPHNSKIKLNRYERYLEIVFQQESIKDRSPIEPGLFLGLSVALFPILAPFSWLFSLFFLLLAVSFSMYDLSAFDLFSQTHHRIVSIHKNGVVKQTSFKGKRPAQPKWHNVYSSEAFNLIVYSPGFVADKYVDNNGKSVKRGKFRFPQQLSLYAKDREFVISDRCQSEPELFWLGKEIGDFLDLELQIVYSRLKTHQKIEPIKFSDFSRYFSKSPYY